VVGRVEFWILEFGFWSDHDDSTNARGSIQNPKSPIKNRIMSRYILRRLLIAVPTLIGITILIFLAMRVLPGDPLAMIFSESSGKFVLSEEELAAARASLGLDKPLYRFGPTSRSAP
jgi:hypothetical protein